MVRLKNPLLAQAAFSLPVRGTEEVAARLLQRGQARMERGRWSDAAEDLSDSLALAQSSGAWPVAGQSLMGLAYQQFYVGDLELAGQLARAAGEAFHAAQRPEDVLRAQFVDLYLHLEREEVDEATRGLRSLLHRAQGSGHRQGRLVGYLGHTLRAQGDLRVAKQRYTHALALLHAEGDRGFVAVFTMDLAIACLLDGELTAGMDALARADALRLVATANDGYLRYLIAHYRALGFILFAKSDASWPTVPELPWPSERLAFLEQVREFAARLRRDGEGPWAARAYAALQQACPPFDHARLSLRLCAQRSQGQALRALVVGAGTQCFRLGDSERVSLAGRQAPRRILEVLVQRRLSAPGRPVSLEELRVAVWPGEKMSPAAARNRLHVALSTLRRLGLRDVLVGGLEGYSIDRHVGVVLGD